MTTYPNAPGFKEHGGTSQAAANVMRGSAEFLRSRVLAALRGRSMTADEVADHLGEDRLSVRPRLSELSRLGKIERTGARRQNQSGCGAWVWRARR